MGMERQRGKEREKETQAGEQETELHGFFVEKIVDRARKWSNLV
jgi:hypothetical protein